IVSIVTRAPDRYAALTPRKIDHVISAIASVMRPEIGAPTSLLPARSRRMSTAPTKNAADNASGALAKNLTTFIRAFGPLPHGREMDLASATGIDGCVLECARRGPRRAHSKASPAELPPQLIVDQTH